MEKTMAMNGKMVGTDITRDVVRGMAQDKKRGHVAIWLEVLRVAHRQWTEAEHGSSYRSTL